MPNVKTASTPFYTKLAMILISIIALTFISILGKKILSPLIFSLLFSILLLPVANFLEKKLRFRRALASLFSILFLVLVIGGTIYLIGTQLGRVADDWPKFKGEILNAVNNIQDWVSTTFHVNIAKQKTYINNAASNAVSAGPSVVGATVVSVSGIVLFLVLTFIYTFFMLFYRRLLMTFLIEVFDKDDSMIVYDVTESVQEMVRKYIVGLLLEMLIVSSVTCIEFSIVGIRYAILLGLITGILNIIPYIGIFTSMLLTSLITFATAASLGKVWLVLGLMISTHIVDANILLPLIVGSKVKLNSLITLLGVVVGELIWGIAGMFLAIPLIAIFKIIFDRIEDLKPWGLLLGDEKDERPGSRGFIRSEAKVIPEEQPAAEGKMK